jgi:hypothetical protein
VTTDATCTHIEAASRDSAKVATCSGLSTKAQCDANTDCYFNPDTQILEETDMACEDTNLQISTMDRETEEACNILCYNNPLCVRW